MGKDDILSKVAANGRCILSSASPLTRNAWEGC
jgi:hypothetical protein